MNHRLFLKAALLCATVGTTLAPARTAPAIVAAALNSEPPSSPVSVTARRKLLCAFRKLMRP